MKLDLAGVGIGPFNLSIAALLYENSSLKSHFFDGGDKFEWHPGLLLPDAFMQTCYLKDLVTAVAPSSSYSFLAYLVEKKRFYRFLASGLSMISRNEFSDYMSWASKRLENLSFSRQIQAIEFHDQTFHLHTKNESIQAKNICLGTGKRPYIPDNFKPALGESVFHASGLLHKECNLDGKRVTIIGGGQTGADIVLNALNGVWGKPEKLTWISRRPNFQPLEESAFIDEYFTPDYVNCFYDLPELTKRREINTQKFTSDGITHRCLTDIYQIMYQRFDVKAEKRWITLQPNRTAHGIRATKSGFNIHCCNALDKNEEVHQADLVILATGFESALADCLTPILPLLNLDNNSSLILGRHFDVQWKHQKTNKIFAVNAGLSSHGIAEPQLSLMAWRSAIIINHLSNKKLFDVSDSQGFIEWLSEEDKPLQAPLSA